MITWLAVALPILLLPATLVVLDLFAGLRARHKTLVQPDGATIEDFDVLVPIYGSIRYLENIPYLSDYGSRVILCTTANESEEFNREIDAVAARHGFRVFRADTKKVAATGKRSTSGTLRDRIIRDAHAMVHAPWVVCLDADTVTVRPLGQLVAAMATRGYDLVSVRLVPSNANGFLPRLQAHEYHTAMLLRRVMPWLVSGACHAARSSVHAHVMSRHSLFFQGNDVEVGLLADLLGYRVGHIPFDVPTTVPDAFTPWLRQRLAWAGGEVRLFFANPQIAVRHPFFWTYGALISIAGFPFRWLSIASLQWQIALVPALYLAALAHLHRGRWDRWLLLMPLYAAASSLLIAPMGLIYYVLMARKDHNYGLIRVKNRRVPVRHAMSSTSSLPPYGALLLPTIRPVPAGQPPRTEGSPWLPDHLYAHSEPS